MTGAMLHPEILIVGAGPAGIAAAIRARECGASVTIVDDNSAAGGQIWRGEQRSPTRRRATRWFERFHAAGVSTIGNARVVSGNSRARTLLVETDSRAFEITFRTLILATGARELFLPFPGWTLPGIAGVGGLQALAKSGLPVEHKRVIVAGSGPLLLAAAQYFRKKGAHVVLIAEQAPTASLIRFGFELARHPDKLCQAAGLQLSLMGIPYRRGCWVEKAEGADRLERLRFRRGMESFTEKADYAAIAYGLYPNTELAAALGCSIDRTVVTVDELQRTSVEEIYCAGESTGIGGVEMSLAEGEIAGLAAAGHADRARRLFGRREKAGRFARAMESAFALRDELKSVPAKDTIVCRCEDVTYERLQQARSFRAAKLHTRCGMGPCQGRICGPAADFLFGWGTDSIRPPIFPARVGTLALEDIQEATISQ